MLVYVSWLRRDGRWLRHPYACLQWRDVQGTHMPVCSSEIVKSPICLFINLGCDGTESKASPSLHLQAWWQQHLFFMCIEFEISRDFTLQALSTCRQRELQMVAQIEGAKPTAWDSSIMSITRFKVKRVELRPVKRVIFSSIERLNSCYSWCMMCSLLHLQAWRTPQFFLFIRSLLMLHMT